MPWTCIIKLEIPLGSTWTPGVRISKFRKVYWWGLMIFLITHYLYIRMILHTSFPHLVSPLNSASRSGDGSAVRSPSGSKQSPLPNAFWCILRQNSMYCKIKHGRHTGTLFTERSISNYVTLLGTGLLFLFWVFSYLLGLEKNYSDLKKISWAH